MIVLLCRHARRSGSTASFLPTATRRALGLVIEAGGAPSRQQSTQWTPKKGSSSIARFYAARFSTVPTPVPPDDSNALPAKPIDFSISSRIEGQESNVAMVTLEEGQMLRAESGAMVFMTEGVEMDTKLAGASSAFSRFLTGQNVFLTDYRYKGGYGEKGTVALGTDFPSKILRLHLPHHPDSSLVCQRGAFLASNPTVDIKTEFTQSLTAGFFGGQGFILQRLSGEGDVLVKAGGTLVKKELEEGEVLRVTSGSIVAFETSCQYNVQMMPGVKNVMFGGEGLFVTTLTGPGTVWLQGMPSDRMIAEIARRVPSGGGLGWGVPIGMGGGGGSGAEGAADAAAADAAAADEGSADVAAAADASSATEVGDAAVAADRQATVASSDLDADSPEALFGDAAGESAQDASSSSFPSSSGGDDATSFSTDDTASFGQDSAASTDFSDGGFSSDSTDPFSNTDFSSPTDDGAADGELFSDSGSGDTSSGDTDDGGGILETLWQIFTGGDE